MYEGVVEHDVAGGDVAQCVLDAVGTGTGAERGDGVADDVVDLEVVVGADTDPRQHRDLRAVPDCSEAE